MPTVLSRSVLGAMLFTLIAGASLAQAAPTPGPVSVRVEGSSATLVPSTLVATQPGSFSPIADAAHTCPGTSAAAALELATLTHATGWTGTYFTSLGDYLVTAIAREVHPSGPTDGSYWALWYDHKPATAGICGTPMNPNDEILLFPDCSSYGTATCPPGFVSPDVLGMTAPAVAQKGTPVSVGVTTYASAADGAASPAANATVSGGGATASTTAAGSAALTFPGVGTFTLQATAPNSIRSETHTICVHDANDGNCGTPPPPGTTPPGTTPPPACVHHGDDGLCGTTDRTPPRGHLVIAQGTRFPHRHGPRTLTGRIEADPSGLRDVVLRITRIVTHGRCEAYNASRRKFARAACGLAHAPSFSVGRGLTFSYLLPAVLTRGRYTVEVEATDGAGNHDAPAPGRNRVVFRVD